MHHHPALQHVILLLESRHHRHRLVIAAQLRPNTNLLPPDHSPPPQLPASLPLNYPPVYHPTPVLFPTIHRPQRPAQPTFNECFNETQHVRPTHHQAPTLKPLQTCLQPVNVMLVFHYPAPRLTLSLSPHLGARCLFVGNIGVECKEILDKTFGED